MSGGFALRINGSCAANEQDCGQTMRPYRACCPQSASFCPSAYNVDCCPTSANCTQTLVSNPQCANSTWDLYDNGGYFCCEKGTTGYAATTNSNGCAEAGYAFRSGERLLPIVSAGIAASSTSSVVASTSLGSTPTASPSAASSSTSSNTGAIAGGVVGGVGGLALVALGAWFIRRKNRSKDQPPETAAAEIDGKNTQPSELSPESAMTELDHGTVRSELDHGNTRSELDSAAPVRYELGA